MKPTKRRLLCATDFSEGARRAGDSAAALAARLGARLTLAHVADETRVHERTEAEWREFAAPIHAALRKEAARLAVAGVEVKPRLLRGSWAERALADALRPAPELVVVAAAGKTELERWALGSVSERIAESVEAPTLVVRGENPFRAWARGARPRVLVAVDFTASSEAALRWAARLRELGPCDIVIGHASDPAERRAIYGAAGPVDAGASEAEMLRMTKRDVAEKARRFFPDGGFRVAIRSGWERADTLLIEMARKFRVDLVALGTHQRIGWRRLGHESISRGVLRRAPMSVVCVPRGPGDASAAPLHGHRRALVATDFSEASDGAVPHALACLPAGGVLRLIHVAPPWSNADPPRREDGGARMTQAEHRSLLANARRRLWALSAVAAGRPDVTVERAVVAHRDPGTGILQEAARFGADVVVISSKGRGGLSRALVGSIARQVLADCVRPVLVIRSPPA